MFVSSASFADACSGDCDGDQVVAVDELIGGVDAALGIEPSSPCPHFDSNGDASVALDELLRGVRSALAGCPDAVAARGFCEQPGPSGLEACSPGTTVRAAACANPRVCLDPDPGEALPVASASIATDGGFALVVDRRRAGALPIVLDAEVEAGLRYRSITFLDGRESRLDPLSEATARLLDERGLEGFDADGVAAVEAAVRLANAGETFAGLNAAEAADRATELARADTEVQAAIDESFTPARVTLRIAPAAGPAGTTAELSVALTTAGEAVVATENLLRYDPSAPIAARPGGAPECTVNPSIRKNGTIFSFQPTGCTPGNDCTAVKAFVVALDDLRPIADGAVLYTCEVAVSASLLAGDVLPLLCSTARYSGPAGPIPAPLADCTDGAVAVVAPE